MKLSYWFLCIIMTFLAWAFRGNFAALVTLCVFFVAAMIHGVITWQLGK